MEGNEELLEREMESDLDKRSKSRVDLIMSSRETVTLNSPFSFLGSLIPELANILSRHFNNS